MEKALDADKKQDGLQLPEKFETTFKDFKNKSDLVKEAAIGFKGMDETNKTAIKDKAATEITWWTKMPVKWEKDYSQKIAVLYLYTALNDPTKINPDDKDVIATFTKLKAEATNTAPAAGEEVATEALNDKKTAAIAVLEWLYNTTNDGYDADTITALNTAKENGTTKINAATTEAEITKAQTDATKDINALQLKALTDAQTAAKNKFTTAVSALKIDYYTPENWANIQKAKTEWETAIDNTTNKTPALVVIAETQAEATIGAIPTKAQEIQSNTNKIDNTQNDLAKLQNTEEFKALPKEIKKPVSEILDINEEDQEVDKNIADISQQIRTINDKIENFNTDNVDKANESLRITQDIALLKEQKLNTKDLEQQQAKLTTAMENNNAKIASLKNELIAPQARLERLQKRNKTIEWRLEDKLTDIANVLQTEINKRAGAIPGLKDENIKTTLTNEITTIKKIQTNIQTLQDANASLAQLDNPVIPAANKTASTEQITATNLAAMTERDRETYTKWLKTLDKATATELAKLNWPLYLDWLPTLDKDTAAALAKLPNWFLSLNWLKELNKDIATELAQLKWPLYLSWLPTLDAATAAELAKLPNWTLFLDWLTTIDPATATELAKLPNDRLFFWSQNITDIVNAARSPQA